MSRERSRPRSNFVLTNGCFDILHLGHIRYLQKAKGLARHLIVAVDSDKSVRELKPGRPIQNEQTRLEIIQALRCVNHAFIFDDMMDVLREYKPMIYAKGGDYTIETINQKERKFIESYGGKIFIIKTGITESTTKIYERYSNHSNG